MYFITSDEQLLFAQFLLQIFLCLMQLLLPDTRVIYVIIGNSLFSICYYFQRKSNLRLWYCIQPIIGLLKIAELARNIWLLSYVIPIIQIISLAMFRYFTLFYQFEVTGGYEVGYKEFRLKNFKQTAIAVFYPCATNSKSEKNWHFIKWFRDGLFSLKGLCSIKIFGQEISHFQRFLYQDTLLYGFKAYYEAAYHNDFIQGFKKMVPIIFSPGIMGTRTQSSNICRNLASHGCIVYSIEHTDDTSLYFHDPDPNHKTHNFIATYNKGFRITEEEYRQNQIKLRISEINDLILHLKQSKEPIELSLLGICGFSFGGMTALEANYQIKDIKYSISLDPYFKPRWREVMGAVNSFWVKKHYLIMSSSDWHDNEELIVDFPSWTTVYHGISTRLNIKLKNSNHFIFTDWPMIYPLFFKSKEIIPGDCNIEQSIKTVNNAIILFLNKIQVLQEQNIDNIDQINFFDSFFE